MKTSSQLIVILLGFCIFVFGEVMMPSIRTIYVSSYKSMFCFVGFKPGQRKVMYTCFKRNLVKELKVAQLAGSVAEISAYHHGEVSLMGQ